MREHLVNLCATCYKTAHDPDEQGERCIKKYGIEEEEEERQFRQRKSYNLGNRTVVSLKDVR